jgi:hypothetical protein
VQDLIRKPKAALPPGKKLTLPLGKKLPLPLSKKLALLRLGKKIVPPSGKKVDRAVSPSGKKVDKSGLPPVKKSDQAFPPPAEKSDQAFPPPGKKSDQALHTDWSDILKMEKSRASIAGQQRKPDRERSPAAQARDTGSVTPGRAQPRQASSTEGVRAARPGRHERVKSAHLLTSSVSSTRTYATAPIPPFRATSPTAHRVSYSGAFSTVPIPPFTASAPLPHGVSCAGAYTAAPVPPSTPAPAQGARVVRRLRSMDRLQQLRQQFLSKYSSAVPQEPPPLYVLQQGLSSF